MTTHMTKNAVQTTNEEWLADNRASIHVTTDDRGMFDVQDNNDAVVIGDGTSVKINKVGSLNLMDCRGNKILLKNVAYVSQFHKNIVLFRFLTSF